MGFKMKGPSMYPNYKKTVFKNGIGAQGDIPGQQKKGYEGMADGRATSSPFQAKKETLTVKKGSAADKKSKKKTKEDYIKEGFTPADADRMMKDGAVTGEVDQSKFEPAYEGADYSQADIDTMSEKEKIAKIDGYTPKTKKTKK